MQWITIFKKESLESWRNFKWVWVTLVFILLGIMDPLSTYYLPQILDYVGGLPEGSTVNIPTPPPANVLMMSLSQFNMIGVLIITLMSMGTIAGEVKSGIAELILVKPVSYRSYVTAKWTATLAISLTAVFIGLLSGWYYVNLLFGTITFTSFLLTFVFYSLWIALVVSISLFVNTLFKIPGLVGFLTLTIIVILTIVTNILSHILVWSPPLVTRYLGDMLSSGEIPADLWGTTSITIIITVLLLVASIYTLKVKELA